MFDFPPPPRSTTPLLARQLTGDSRELLALLPDDSVDLIMTSPPFALLRQKAYGNEEQADYVAWLSGFGQAAHRVLKPSGSFVLDLGGAYERGNPFARFIIFACSLDFCDNLGYCLAEEFFWFNPAKLAIPHRVGQQAENPGQGRSKYRLVVLKNGIPKGRRDEGAGSLLGADENVAQEPIGFLHAQGAALGP